MPSALLWTGSMQLSTGSVHGSALSMRAYTSAPISRCGRFRRDAPSNASTGRDAWCAENSVTVNDSAPRFVTCPITRSPSHGTYRRRADSTYQPCIGTAACAVRCCVRMWPSAPVCMDDSVAGASGACGVGSTPGPSLVCCRDGAASWITSPGNTTTMAVTAGENRPLFARGGRDWKKTRPPPFFFFHPHHRVRIDPRHAEDGSYLIHIIRA